MTRGRRPIENFAEVHLPLARKLAAKRRPPKEAPPPARPLVPLKTLTPDHPLTALIDNYAVMRLAGCNPQTKKKFEIACRHTGEAIGREPTIADLTEESIQRMVALVLQLGRSRATAVMYRKKMRALWEFAARRRVITDFPDLAKMAEPKRTPVAFTKEQLKRLFDECAKQKGQIAGIPSALWLRALLLTIWDTGERISAVLAIRFDWLNFESGFLTIPAEFRKGKLSDMTWELHPSTLDAIRQIERPSRDLIFTWPLTRLMLWTKWFQMLKRAGLPTGRKYGFHAIRKSSATYLKLAGGDATAHLGHTTAQMTERYIDPTIAGTCQASNLLFRPDGEGGVA